MTSEIVDNVVDIEVLIAEVKNYKEIWNMADESYHDRVKKRNAWINIARVFFPSFDDKDDKEKNDLCEKLSKKWRNVKDNFYKSEKKKRSREKGNFVKRYVYARQLSFLKTASNGAEGGEFGQEQDQEDFVQKRESPPGAEVKESERHDDARLWRKRKRDVQPGSGPNHSKSSSGEPNPDMSFFESIMPFILNFTEDQKLEFRSEILHLIKRIRFGQTHNYGYQANVPYSDNLIVYPKSELSSFSPRFSPCTNANHVNTIEDDSS